MFNNTKRKKLRSPDLTLTWAILIFTMMCAHGQHHLHDNCSIIPNECDIPGCEVLNCTASQVEEKLELFDLLARGTEFLDNYTDVTEAIVLLGNTGSGKSTLTQILAGNLSKLHSSITLGCDFVIIDDDNRIGLSSTKSKTLFPELVFKTETNTTALAFYDFPGFDDTRGDVLDIAANFFMNQVITKISTVKMLFLATHSSFQDAGSFNLLATHAATFVKSFQKYKNSFALVVTKVASYGPNGPTPDRNIISGIVGVLNTYLDELRSDLSNNSEQDTVLLNKILFVETLLQRDPTSGNYTKIWFVRSPFVCGPLSEQEMIHHTKNNITKLYQDLSYTGIDTKADFGFTLKAETKLVMANYTNSINLGISSAVHLIAADLEKNCLKSGNLVDFENLNFTSLNRTMHANSLFVRSIVDTLGTNISNSIELSNVLKSTSRSFGYHVPARFHSFMGWQEEYLSFFDKAIGENQERQVTKWSEPILKLNQVFQDLSDWYEFCLLLETHVSSYLFQSIKYDLPPKSHTESWINFIETHRVVPVSRHIKEIASLIGNHNLDLLKVIMAFALESHDEFCDPTNNAIVFKGNFIQLGKLPDPSSFLTKCGNTTTQVHIYASRMIFLDIDIKLENLDLVMIAPIWVNPNQVEININLSGKAASYEYPKAINGNDFLPGSSGCVGFPGDPGGTMFGISSFVHSSFPVSIISQGGKGGEGQEGGNGGTGFSYNARGPDDGPFYDKPDRKAWNLFNCFNPIVSNIYEQYGISGDDGTDGGDGGLSGTAGIQVDSNNVSLVIFQGQNLVNFSSKQGENGVPGLGGRGGSGGAAGRGYYCTYNCAKWSCSSRAANPEKGRVPGSAGRNGRSGISSLYPKDPESPRELIKWPALLNYRITLFNQTDLTTKTFFTDIDKRSETKDIFSLKALAEESLALESLDRNDVNPNRLREMYTSLIIRLEEFSKTNYNSLSDEHKKIVNVLLTLTYSSVMNFKRGQNYDVIVDVSHYFSIIQRQINSLRTLTALQAIRQAKETFTDNLKGKINQALGFIEETVTPALNQAKEDLEDKVNLLGNQLVSLIEDTKLSLEEMKDKLRKANAQQGILNSLKAFSLISNIFSALIPIPGFSAFHMLVQQLQEKYSGQENQLERLEQLVEEAEKLMEELEEKREEFEDEFQPLVDSLLEYFKNVSNSLNSGNEIRRPELLLTKWQVMTNLKEVKNSLDVFADASLNLQPLTHAIDRIQDALTMAIDLYEMIEEYLETASLADYISTVNSAHLGPVPISDPEFVHTVGNFDIKVRENLLDVEVKRAIHAFKQWVFPFAKFYFRGQPTFVTTRNVSSELGAEHLHQLENLQLDLERYKAMLVGNQDPFIISMDFSSGYASSTPFFTWNNEQWHDNIKLLLSGNKVNFQADVRMQGMAGWEAIKFKLIEINFMLNGASNDTKEEFDDILDYFGVSMTHSGMSYYRFQQDYFVMTGANQTLRYNFERDSRGNRLGTNQVYEKFRSGDFLLSPYTLWTFQLRNVVPLRKGKLLRQNVGFDSLEKFLPYIDVELVGNGTYTLGEAALGAANGDMQLDLYYERDNRVSVDFKF